MRKTEFIANFISFFYFDFYYFLHCYYYHHHINITSCSKISFWIFHLFPLLASVYPTIFKEPQWKQLLCYPCHRNSFTAFLTISSVLIKLLLFSSNYANFYLFCIIFCGGERYLLTKIHVLSLYSLISNFAYLFELYVTWSFPLG